MPKNILSGVAFVLIGSSSYGLLSTFVKLAYKEGFTTAEITTSQFLWGALVLTFLALLAPKAQLKASSSDKLKLIVAGTTTGFTSVFYYISVNYIEASIAVVLLMQSIWMGVLFECFLRKRPPTLDKLVATILVLFGTLLATNSLSASTTQLNIRGLIFGLLSAVSYSCTLAATGSVAAHLTAIKRSQYMLYGGVIVALGFAFLTQIGPYIFDLQMIGSEFVRNQPFNFSIFKTYGLMVAIFGTILPPIVLNKGFPITGVGLGSIISSVELPVAAIVASLLLGERINLVQFSGIVLILVSVFVLNFRFVRQSLKNGFTPRA